MHRQKRQTTEEDPRGRVFYHLPRTLICGMITLQTTLFIVSKR